MAADGYLANNFILTFYISLILLFDNDNTCNKCMLQEIRLSATVSFNLLLLKIRYLSVSKEFSLLQVKTAKLFWISDIYYVFGR